MNYNKKTTQLHQWTMKDTAFWAFIMAAVLLILFCKIAFVVGSSMEPTMSPGEVHLYYNYGTPEVGDIVLLQPEGEDRVLVKRIAAGPGEQVKYQNETITLEEDEFFVLGDNRDNSLDSRRFGPIPKDSILGTLII